MGVKRYPQVSRKDAGCNKWSLSVCLVMSSLTLAACGGGGASSPQNSPTVLEAPPPPPPAPPAPTSSPEEFRTAEYNAHWGLEAINAAEAYAQGYTGAGVTIGLVDFNFNIGEPDLDVTYDPRSLTADQRWIDLYEEQFGEPITPNPHGYAVSTVAAGTKNDSVTHGVAFDANVIAVEYFSGVNLRVQTSGNATFNISNPWKYLADNGARVVNKSLGFDEDSTTDSSPSSGEKYAVEWDVQAVLEGLLLVVSAGNDGEPDPSTSTLTTIRQMEENGILNSGPGGFIISGALAPDGTLADFSDRAGVAKDFYLAAPGQDIVFPWTNGIVSGGGTSFAAPHITGAAAILFQRWPELTAREVANILFDTATDLGDPGIDDIYGHGALNLAAALEPVGTVVAAGKSNRAPVANSTVDLPTAFGDGGSLSTALASISVFDTYNRDFQFDLSGRVRPGFSATLLSDRLDTEDSSASSIQLGNNTLFQSFAHRPGRIGINSLYDITGNEDLKPREQVSLSLTGHYGGTDWSLAKGYGFDQAFGINPIVSLAQQSFTPATLATDMAATTAFALPGAWTLTSYASYAQRDTDDSLNLPTLAPVQDFGPSNQTVAALRLDRHVGDSSLYIVTAAMQEQGSFLGTRSAGALTLASGGTSMWLTSGADLVKDGWSVHFSATAGTAQADGTDTVLITSLRPTLFSSLYMAAQKHGILSENDSLQLSVSQPLRIERAFATVSAGVGRSALTGQLDFAETRVNLAPSGREFAFSAGYANTLGDWSLNMNALYRMDAGHIRGLQDIAALVTLGRRF